MNPKADKFKSWIKLLLRETSNEQAQYAIGYRRGESNYHDKNLKSDFTGYSPAFINGYKQGIKDARMGKFNQAVMRILTSLADILGRGRYHL